MKFYMKNLILTLILRFFELYVLLVPLKIIGPGWNLELENVCFYVLKQVLKVMFSLTL